jgi:hypothetical protein
MWCVQEKPTKIQEFINWFLIRGELMIENTLLKDVGTHIKSLIPLKYFIWLSTPILQEYYLV